MMDRRGRVAEWWSLNWPGALVIVAMTAVFLGAVIML